MRQCRQTNRIMFPAKACLSMSRGNAWLSPLDTFFRLIKLYEARDGVQSDEPFNPRQSFPCSNYQRWRLDKVAWTETEQ